MLNENSLHQWLPKLVSPFPENPSKEVLRDYITGTTYGARSQLVRLLNRF